MRDDRYAAAMLEHYGRGEEADRLVVTSAGQLEFERTQEIVLRRLPPAPAVVADIGGGPGRYALWLAGLGYRVVHRDVVPLHVEQLAAAAVTDPEARSTIDSAVGDARSLDLPDASVDAVLLLGPLYHLTRRADRIEALREARRVVRPGGPVFGAAISRWAARYDGVLRLRLYEQVPAVLEAIGPLERTGVLPPLGPGQFTAYTHRPGQLRDEFGLAGLVATDVVSVECGAYLLPDLKERMADPQARQVIMDSAGSASHSQPRAGWCLPVRWRAVSLARVRLTLFWDRMREQFGDVYAQSVAQDYVLADLGSRTVNQALADGEDVKVVWQAICKAFRVPERRR